jgi:hypothetical protein
MACVGSRNLPKLIMAMVHRLGNTWHAKGHSSLNCMQIPPPGIRIVTVLKIPHLRCKSQFLHQRKSTGCSRSGYLCLRVRCPYTCHQRWMLNYLGQMLQMARRCKFLDGTCGRRTVDWLTCWAAATGQDKQNMSYGGYIRDAVLA